MDTKNFQSRKPKAAAGVAKFPDRPAHSLGDPANTTARTAGGSHDPTPSNAAEFVAMRLRVDNSHTFRIAGSEAVELTAVIDEVPRYLEALYSARSRIARASKLKSHSLPIAISIANGEIVMSILTPPGKDQESILAMSRGVCNAIAEKWRATGELAKNTVSGVSRSAAVTHPSFSAEGTSESRTGAPPSTDGGLGFGDGNPVQRAEPPPAQIDPMARRLLEALLARQRAGNLSLQFTSAGQPVDHPPVIVPPSLPLPAPNITCGDEHVIVAEICHRSGAASCLVREDGGTKLKKATFSTSSSLSTIINFLLGCPAVQLKVRNFVSDHPQAKPKYDCVIEQIVGPTEEWGVEPYVLDYLADCLAELRALMQPDVQSPLLE